MAPKGRDPRAKEHNNRPGWKGPSYIKKPASKPATKEKSVASTGPLHPIPLELQQLLLNIFSNTFPETLQSDELSSSLQEVKQALFERDFERAFGRQEYLQSYAVRWSPSRALGYSQVLANLHQYFMLSKDSCHKDRPYPKTPIIGLSSPMRVVCFGGGAAEVVAFGGFLKYLKSQVSSLGHLVPQENSDHVTTTEEANPTWMKLLLVDTAAWKEVSQRFSDALATPPILSKYASESAKANNPSLLPKNSLLTSFEQTDALILRSQDISRMIGPEPALITLLFTLNELYTTSISKTTTFLLHITAAATPGTLLLVVDSPGSYSETAIGKDSKKYPMQWLMNHTLLEKSKLDEDSPSAWDRVVSEDSEWFRLGERLRYPIALEDMRYQVHLYRRV